MSDPSAAGSNRPRVPLGPVLLAVLVVAIVAVAAWWPPGSEEASPTTSIAPSEPTGDRVPSSGIVTVPAGGAGLSEVPGGLPTTIAAGGLVFPIAGSRDGWVSVVTQCDAVAWIDPADVAITPRIEPGPPGPGFDLSSAVVVLDPGHGGARNTGAVGPAGLVESVVNLDIAIRLEALMAAPRDIDPVDGSVRAGTSIPTFGRVWLTRRPEWPDGGDIEAGLGYRAALGGAAGAHALVSIHNNASPTHDLDVPGTDVFWSVAQPGSDRLASLIHEEVTRSLLAFPAPWRGAESPGPVARVFSDSGDDFYGLLRRAEVPSVIVEGLYLSEAAEEALLETSAVRQAYAEGVYRGLVRYLTSDELGSPVARPVAWAGSPGGGTLDACEVPVG